MNLIGAAAGTKTPPPPRNFAKGRSQILERETGFEPATLSLGKRAGRKQ